MSDTHSIIDIAAFLKNRQKVISVPNCGDMLIRKVSAATFFGIEGLPSQNKGAIRVESIEEKAKKGYETRLVTIMADDLTDETYKEAKDLYKKIAALEKLAFNRQQDITHLILSEGLVSPKFSLTGDTDCISPKDLDLDTLNFIATEILSFSGITGAGASAIETFQNVEAPNANVGCDSEKIQNSPV